MIIGIGHWKVIDVLNYYLTRRSFIKMNFKAGIKLSLSSSSSFVLCVEEHSHVWHRTLVSPVDCWQSCKLVLNFSAAIQGPP